MAACPGTTRSRSSVRHKTKSLDVGANYTFSKSLDNVSAEGNGFTDAIDNFNLGLNKGRSDFDRPHVFNVQAIYTLPIGHGHLLGHNMPRWANTLIGGWDIGGLGIWESGDAMTASSGRYTAVSYNTSSWDNYQRHAAISESVMRQRRWRLLHRSDRDLATSPSPASPITATPAATPSAARASSTLTHRW